MQKAPPPQHRHIPTGARSRTRPDHLADPRPTNPILEVVSPHATRPCPRAGLLDGLGAERVAYVLISDSADTHAGPRLSAVFARLTSASLFVLATIGDRAAGDRRR